MCPVIFNCNLYYQCEFMTSNLSLPVSVSIHQYVDVNVSLCIMYDVYTCLCMYFIHIIYVLYMCGYEHVSVFS